MPGLHSPLSRLACRSSALAALLLAGLAHLASPTPASAFPQPSPYPTSWEFKLDVDGPRRLVVDDKAYWYLTYHVTNQTGQERVFLPVLEILTPDGKVARSDRLIPGNVVREVKRQAGGKFLEAANEIAGEVRIGVDQARDGVAIWPESNPDDREFTLFFSGFSGETATVDGPDGKPVKLFKTLSLTYAVGGDPKFRQINEIREVARSYVFR